MGTRQFISAKTLQKCLRRAEPVYLALVRPKFTQQVQGMTQKVKRERMKTMGLVREAPLVAETRKRICAEALAGL